MPFRCRSRSGGLLLERGRATDAARVFGETAAMAATAGEEPLEVEARIWLSLAKTDQGQLTSAEAICRALLQAARLSDAHRTWITAVLVRVLLWQRRLHDALALPALGCVGDALDAVGLGLYRCHRRPAVARRRPDLRRWPARAVQC
jgi:hypothetical protein